MIDTYIQHLQIAALESFEEVSDSSLQASTDEDAVTEVIEQNGSEGVNVTWSQRRDAVISCILRLSSLISLILNKTKLNSNSRCGVPWKWHVWKNSLFKRDKSLSLSPAKASSVGAKSVKSPSCLSISVSPAASIRDKKILQQRSVSHKDKKAIFARLDKNANFLTWMLRFSPEVGTWWTLVPWSGSSWDGGHRYFPLCFHGSSRRSQCRLPS